MRQLGPAESRPCTSAQTACSSSARARNAAASPADGATGHAAESRPHARLRARLVVHRRAVDRPRAPAARSTTDPARRPDGRRSGPTADRGARDPAERRPDRDRAASTCARCRAACARCCAPSARYEARGGLLASYLPFESRRTPAN
ncbi:MAG: hypothetical protein MZV49_10680 [Rhodopseudomonas palustris]|nr:hypothetical protein [Rhodopseudomonas palustris]